MTTDSEASTVPELIEPELIARYAVPVPRYTSYPSALEFTQNFSVSDWVGILREHISCRDSAESAALYVHLPFCPSLCYFCACTKIIVKDRHEITPYLRALTAEIESYGALFRSPPPIAQMHFGGGSPSFLSPAEIRNLFERIKNIFPVMIKSPDISIELDPRTTSEQLLQTIRSLGVNRLSVGVQDFAPQVQVAINRVQSFEVVAGLFEKARALGFSGINVDLIYGLPGQTSQSIEETIDQVVTLCPDRIALYGYAHVTWIKKTQKVLERVGLPDPNARIELFLTALRLLSKAGYEYIGMDHFALPSDSLAKAKKEGSLHRNFMGYAAHRTDMLLGFGMSAISSTPQAFAQNHRTLKSYYAALQTGGFGTERGLARTEDDRRRDSIIQSIMCEGFLDFAQWESQWQIDFNEAIPEVHDSLTSLEADGLVTQSRSGVKVTPRGRFFLRNIASVFDAYLQRHSKSQAFSQAV